MTIDAAPSLLLPALLCFVGGYLCGSVPFGLLIAKLGGAGDIRSIGSGNIGATNVLRTGRKGLAAATLLADALKGYLPVIAVLLIWPVMALPTALGAFIGHLFPVWLKFKGGKGIAVYIGTLIAISWVGAVAFAIVWLAVAMITRYSSLAALIATVVVPIVIWSSGVGPSGSALVFALMTALAWYMHRANINRLLAGTESRIGSKG